MAQVSLNTTNKIKFLLDLIAGISALVLLSPALTGNAIHEWLGLAIIIPLLIHLVMNWQWITVTIRRFFGKIPWRSRVNFILNLVLFILMTAEGFTGLMISKDVLPFLGLSVANNHYYKSLHTLLPNIMLIVLGLHLGLNWKWIVAVIKNNIPILSRRSQKPRNESSSVTAQTVKMG